MWAVWIMAYYTVKNDYVIPSFTDTVTALGLCLASGTFWTAFAFTFLRTLEAFVLSFLFAAAFCALSSLSRIFRLTVAPIMVLLRTLPTLAVILMIILWTNAKVAPVIVTFLVLFPMMYSQLETAVGGIDSGLKDMCRVYNIGKKQRLLKIYLPLISPAVFSQSGANISLGIKIMISAEVLSNTFKSLGGMMQEARMFLDIPKLGALTIVAVIAGLILDIGLSQLTRLTYKWNRKEGGND